MTRPFQLAMIQMFVEPGARKTNLQHACELINQATEAGADVVLLPEALPLGWTHPGAESGTDAIPDGETCRLFREAARKHAVHVCVGLTEQAGSRTFNSAVLIAPSGEVILHHRKINELEIAHDSYGLGDRLGVAQTEFGRFGLMICADGFAQGQCITRALGYMGADIILSPCAWAVPNDHDIERDPYGQIWLDNYQPVARRFRLWIAGCSNVGPITAGAWAGRKCIGCSLLVGPDGSVAARGPYGLNAETILHAEVQLTTRDRAFLSDL